MRSDLLGPLSLSAQRDRSQIGRPSWRDADNDRAALDREEGEVDGGVLGSAIARGQFALEIKAIALAERAALECIAQVGFRPDRGGGAHP